MFLGIDPGKSGACALIDGEGRDAGTIQLKETDHDISDFLIGAQSWVKFAVLENVHSMPKQGVRSTFNFGRSFGFVAGVLASLKIPYELVAPTVWQTAMKCRSSGDKNVTKQAAQRLFPETTITHATADAFLLAEFARRTFNKRKGTE
jgi:crossover junction endodeoxyribonuclease RuvC